MPAQLNWRAVPGLRSIGAEEEAAALEALRTRQLSRGLVDEIDGVSVVLERAFADRFGRRHAVLLNSGTSALLAALAPLVAPGDEVVVPAYGWLTNLTTVLHLGGVPVLAPVTPDLRLDPARLAECLSARTRAVVLVHPFGTAADLDAVRTVAPDLAVVEDGCQSFGARRADGSPVGAGPAAVVFSFQSAKLLTCGEGGLLLLDDPAAYCAAVAYHDAGLLRFAHGIESAPSVALGTGLNLRLGELAAAVLAVQLRRADEILAAQRDAWGRLAAAFEPWLASGRGRLVAADHAEATNGTGLVLVARSAHDAVGLATQLRRAGIGATRAVDDLTHSLPGWQPYLEERALPFRVVDAAATTAALERTILLEVNRQLSEPDLDHLAGVVSAAVA